MWTVVVDVSVAAAIVGTCGLPMWTAKQQDALSEASTLLGMVRTLKIYLSLDIFV